MPGGPGGAAGEENGFYSKCNGRLLKSFSQEGHV